jgi:hypothetical protein
LQCAAVSFGITAMKMNNAFSGHKIGFVGLGHMGRAIVLLLALLEWRSSKWPRYRRATVGIGTFLLNSNRG